MTIGNVRVKFTGKGLKGEFSVPQKGLREALANMGMPLSENYPRKPPSHNGPVIDTHWSMTYEDWQESQRVKGMQNVKSRRERDDRARWANVEGIGREGFLGVNDVPLPLPGRNIDNTWSNPKDIEPLRADMVNPDLPDIDGYDEMLKTAGGRAEIRRIRQEQLKHHQSTTDGRRVRKDEVVD